MKLAMPSGNPSPQPAVPHWECVAESAAFSIRDTAEPFLFDNRMWMSNGYTDGDVLIRDLWNSADGVAWDRVLEKTPYDGYSEIAFFHDQLWAVKESVWTSSNGRDWKLASERTPFGARGYGELVVFRDRLWQLGSGKDVWTSLDGINWNCAISEAPYGDRYGSAVTVFENKLWLMGGATLRQNNPPEKHYPQYTTHNDVWCSADGIEWHQMLLHAPWAERQWVVAEVYQGRLWILGGFSNRENHNFADAWSTADGITWEAHVSTPMFSPRHEVTPYVFQGSLWVISGNAWPLTNDVWRLTMPPNL